MMPSLAHDPLYISSDDFSITWDTPTWYDAILGFQTSGFVPTEIPGTHFTLWSGSGSPGTQRTVENVVLASHWDTNGYKFFVALRCTPWGLPGTWHRVTYDGLEPLFVDEYGFPVPSFDRVLSN